MTEHEKLKEICDKINYNCRYQNDGYRYIKTLHWGEGLEPVNVREIIFTQAFMGKLHIYWIEKEIYILGSWSDFNVKLMENLYSPVDYLYKTLQLGK